MSAAESLRYPHTPEVDQTDDYHGTIVKDPYRWLEDLDSEETRAWVQNQNRLTFGYLRSVEGRDKLKERLTELWNFEKYDVPFKKGHRYFYTKNDGLQNQSVLYMSDALDAEPKAVLDPNALSADGTAALSIISISDDGRWLAYGVSVSGSDWIEIKVRNVDTGADLPETLSWVKFSGAAWTPDSKGFFYCRYPQPEPGAAYQDVNLNQKLYYHLAGTPQDEDALIYERPDEPEWGFNPTVSEDGSYLVLSIWQGTDSRNRLYYRTLDGGTGSVTATGGFTPLFDEFDAEYSYIGNAGHIFYILTDSDAPRKRLIAVDLESPSKGNWVTVLPERPEVLDYVTMAGDGLASIYMKDAGHRIYIDTLCGEAVKELQLPTLGTVSGIWAKQGTDELFYGFTSFLYPNTIFRHAISTGETQCFARPSIDFDPTAFETKQIWYESKDGTPVPMFVTHRKGLVLNGQNPVYLYGYGGFDISITPGFSVSALVWMEHGGVYAVANIRGGSEFGEEWHKAGMLDKKQNVFDDFIAAAEHLIASGYTNPRKLAIGGGSNGGLLVSACMVQRPDLFGAVHCAVPVADMLRFHKFTIGWAWVSEYGSSDDPDQFRTLIKYSPLHNVTEGTEYPALLVATADHDDRVVPSHSFKLISAIQKAHGGLSPVLIRIETKAGHGAGKPTGKRIEEAADIWAFLLHNLGVGMMKDPGD